MKIIFFLFNPVKLLFLTSEIFSVKNVEKSLIFFIAFCYVGGFKCRLLNVHDEQ